MREGRASFADLLGRIEAHVRVNGEQVRLPELQDFWRAVDEPSDRIASAAFEKLLGLARGQGFYEELLPFVEAARMWSNKVSGRARSYNGYNGLTARDDPRPEVGAQDRRRDEDVGRERAGVGAPADRQPDLRQSEG
jgi:hypothetical protein